MIYHGKLKDKTLLIEALKNETGCPAVYSGAPKFQYRIGSGTVLRNGDLETEEDFPQELLKRLFDAGLLETPQNENREIAYSVAGWNGTRLVNLIFTVSAREKLLCKMTGRGSAFHVTVGLIRKLRDEPPADIDRLLALIHRCGGDSCIRGLSFTKSEVIFTGFPSGSDVPEEERNAFRILAQHMAESTSSKRTVNPVPVKTENEKYEMRIWFHTLGMEGPEYRETRAFLSSGLRGTFDYPTEAEHRAANERRRLAAKRRREETAFTILEG